VGKFLLKQGRYRKIERKACLKGKVKPGWKQKKKGWIEILPRFKIQYPMKNLV